MREGGRALRIRGSGRKERPESGQERRVEEKRGKPRGTQNTVIVHHTRRGETRETKPRQIERRKPSQENNPYRNVRFYRFQLFLVTRGLVYVFCFCSGFLNFR